MRLYYTVKFINPNNPQKDFRENTASLSTEQLGNKFKKATFFCNRQGFAIFCEIINILNLSKLEAYVKMVRLLHNFQVDILGMSGVPKLMPMNRMILTLTNQLIQLLVNPFKSNGLLKFLSGSVWGNLGRDRQAKKILKRIIIVAVIFDILFLLYEFRVIKLGAFCLGIKTSEIVYERTIHEP